MDDNNINNIQEQCEVPIIIIERDNETSAASVKQKTSRSKGVIITLVIACILIVSVAIPYGYRRWSYYHHPGVSISVTPKENIAKLKASSINEVPEVVMTSDSILGVALDFYSLHGLSGSIEFEEPDTADKSIYLYCRSADFTAEGRYLGTLVSKGQVFSSDNERLGYMAMANGNNVIGISRSEDVMEYVQEQQGSFFRQFVLVSNGELPPRFQLHGKVERCAIGRISDRLYYITSRNKETLWSFADALREYGFTDAIYITGGYDYSYYRDRAGERHDIHDPMRYPHTKWKDIIPWLVFRK